MMGPQFNRLAGAEWRHHFRRLGHPNPPPPNIKVIQKASDYPRFTQPFFSPLLHNAQTVNHLHKDALNTGCETCYHTDRQLVIETSFIFLLIFFLCFFLALPPPHFSLMLWLPSGRLAALSGQQMKRLAR